eukprot:754545-Hanusia_phi.AAC.5
MLRKGNVFSSPSCSSVVQQVNSKANSPVDVTTGRKAQSPVAGYLGVMTAVEQIGPSDQVVRWHNPRACRGIGFDELEGVHL